MKTWWYYDTWWYYTKQLTKTLKTCSVSCTDTAHTHKQTHFQSKRAVSSHQSIKQSRASVYCVYLGRPNHMWPIKHHWDWRKIPFSRSAPSVALKHTDRLILPHSASVFVSSKSFSAPQYHLFSLAIILTLSLLEALTSPSSVSHLFSFWPWLV